MKRLSVNEWRAMVFRSNDPRMTAAVKVLCLYLADHMTPNRNVSVPRKQIADDLGCHEQRVAERFKKAVDADYLTNIQPGHIGRTAIYQACRPEVERTANPYTLEGTQSGTHSPLNHGVERTALQDANREAEPVVEPDEANGSQEEEVWTTSPSFLMALETSSIDCPHGLPFGDRVERWNDEVHLTCPDCHAAYRKSEIGKRTA